MTVEWFFYRIRQGINSGDDQIIIFVTAVHPQTVLMALKNPFQLSIGFRNTRTIAYLRHGNAA